MASNKYNSKNEYGVGASLSKLESETSVTPLDLQLRNQEQSINTYNPSNTYPDFK